jgi:hypothetical protein
MAPRFSYGNATVDCGGALNGIGVRPCINAGLVRGQSKNSSLRRFLFRLRSRFSFHYAYCKSSFNLLLEIFSAEHPVRLGSWPDSLKQLWLDVPPKQFPVSGLPLSGFPPKPKIIFVWFNQWVPLPEPVARVAAPAVIGRTIRGVGTNGVELDVPITGEE